MSQGVAVQMRLQDARAELRITQAAMARMAHVSRNTVIAAERGDEVLPMSAHAILNAINDVRRERSLPTYKIDEIDFNVKR